MRQLLNTLFITIPNAYLHLEGDTLRVDVEKEKKIQVPLHHIGSVVCFGDIMVSPAALYRCADEGRSLVFLSRNGEFKARVEGPTNGNILLRQAQHQTANNPLITLDLARSFIAGKIKNARQILLRGAREANNEADQTKLSSTAETLAYSLKHLLAVDTLDSLRGIEGDAAKNYFGCINNLLATNAKPDFLIDGRNRRPPKDPFNALLSFLYTLLKNDCRAALEGVGLDPQLGFLHAVRPGRDALALDMMEEFRAIIADRLALALVNRSQLTAADFWERPGGGIYLKDDSRKTVLVAYQNRKQKEINHPLLEKPAPIGLLPHLQARFLARTIRGEMEGYLPFIAK